MPKPRKGKSIPVTEQSKDDIEAAKESSRKSQGTGKMLELPKTMARIRARGAADMQNAYGDQWSPSKRKGKGRGGRKRSR